MTGFLDRERIVAKPGFSRWLVPPAALCVHLCIGQAYAFSVFNLPMTKLLAGGASQQCKDMSLLDAAVTTTCNWRLTDLGWIFSLAIVFLGLSAAATGTWLDRVGPRKAMFTAALCWGGGFLISALGVYLHQLWLIYLGYGVLGGCGLGIGYISPVKTLITWFPDRPGMATGMAIMGFGGGAFIASPLSVNLMKYFSMPANEFIPTATHVGVLGTFVVMGIIYFCFMTLGSIFVRVPAAGWRPAGYVAPAQPRKLMTDRDVHVDEALSTAQFYLLWFVLFLNVTAGIGVLGQASAMSQQMFPGRIGVDQAAGFVGLMSLFNMGGRFCWASLSDFITRKATYAIFFLLGIALYTAVPWTGETGSKVLFVVFFCIIISMYGGGFSTIPAYLRDVFGTRYVGAIHGRLLTAWSAAGIAGPVLVNYISAYQVRHGVPKAESYNEVMYIMAGLLVIGFFCNLFMHPVNEKHYLPREGTAPSYR